MEHNKTKIKELYRIFDITLSCFRDGYVYRSDYNRVFQYYCNKSGTEGERLSYIRMFEKFIKNNINMKRTKGRFLNKKEWYSICSKHYNYDKDCKLCNTGTWVNVYKHEISLLIFKLFPKVWIWWVNR